MELHLHETNIRQWCVCVCVQVSLESGAKGVYLITDGAADHTHEFLLNQLPSLGSRYAHPWKIHAIGWRCSDRLVIIYGNPAPFSPPPALMFM